MPFIGDILQRFLWQIDFHISLPQETHKTLKTAAETASAFDGDYMMNQPTGLRVNTLYYGDCLTIMQQEMDEESVDLIYLDPPFNSNRNYHTIYKDHTGNPLPEQVEAFCDQWLLDGARKAAIKGLQQTMIEARVGIDHHSAELVHHLIDRLQWTQPKLAAYLSYMTERLIWMKKILKPTGSIYLHCDPTASHYIKTVMDVVFGHKNFRNEIIWTYTGPGSPRMRQFNRKHDAILWYAKNKTWVFNRDDVRIPYKDGKPHTGGFTHKTGKKAGTNMSKEVAESYTGKIPEDWWIDIAIAVRSSKERMGYPTQKPLKLLDRIIKASSNEGDVVFDPFCGCATTLEAAHKLGRNWIGIDIAIHAIKRVAKVRLRERLGLVENQHFIIKGIPYNYEGAHDLWRRDPYQFQQWCVEEVNGFVTNKRSADGGIDGRIYFEMNNVKKLQNMILEVKGGASVPVAHLRALIGALEISDAKMAGLIVMEDLGNRKRRNFQNEMDAAGAIEINGDSYPRVQMLTVAEILNGARFKMPNVRGRTDSGYSQVLLPEA